MPRRQPLPPPTQVTWADVYRLVLGAVMIPLGITILTVKGLLMKRTLVVLMAIVLDVVVVGAVFAQQEMTAGKIVAGPTPLQSASGGLEQAVLNPIGVGLALLFIVLMVSLFRWMFRVPLPLPRSVVKARQSVSALQRILVPTIHDGASERAVELACRLGAAQKAEIVLTYVVEVPFTLSLNTPLPAEESRGRDALHTAQFIVQQYGLPATTRLIPHRSLWGGIVRLAREEQADAIVMGVDGAPGQPKGIGRIAQEVLKRVECEVILDRRAA